MGDVLNNSKVRTVNRVALFCVTVKMPRVKAAQAGRPGPAKRRLAEQFAAGEVLTDMSRKEWKLGLPIGQGGFGCIYLGECLRFQVISGKIQMLLFFFFFF